ANLTDIKKHAQMWLDTIGPSMTTVPQAIISFNNDFQGQSTTILELLDAIGFNKPTPTQKQDLVTLLGSLYDSLEKRQQEILAVNANLVQFNNELGKDYALLSSGADSITKAIKSDQDQLKLILQDIQDLQGLILNLKQEVTSLEIAEGVTIFLGLVGALVAAFSGGTGGAIIVVALTGVGAEVALEVAVKKEIVAAQAKLFNDQDEASAEVKQIAVLNGVAMTVSNLEKQNVSSGAAMTDVLTTWNTLIIKMKAVITDVETAETDIGTILDAGDVRSAVTAWGQLTAFATNMQTALGNLVPLAPVKIAVASAAA
ncbi:MAG TPA: HBL/NHE enterotoxin family protein, partial [Bryobacteraceae bacterium]